MYRINNQNNVLGGICQGLAHKYDIDVTILRFISVCLIFTPLPIITVYIIMWAVLPQLSVVPSFDSNYNNFNKQNNLMSNQSKNNSMIGGLILIVLGVIFSFNSFFNINVFTYIGKAWPLVLIGLGIWIIMKDNDQNPTNNTKTNPEGTQF